MAAFPRYVRTEGSVSKCGMLFKDCILVALLHVEALYLYAAHSQHAL